MILRFITWLTHPQLLQTYDQICMVYNLVAWSNELQMLFNIEKCKVMHLGYNKPKADYAMDGSVLQIASEEKDLGVIVSKGYRSPL